MKHGPIYKRSGKGAKWRSEALQAAFETGGEAGTTPPHDNSSPVSQSADPPNLIRANPPICGCTTARLDAARLSRCLSMGSCFEKTVLSKSRGLLTARALTPLTLPLDNHISRSWSDYQIRPENPISLTAPTVSASTGPYCSCHHAFIRTRPTSDDAASSGYASQPRILTAGSINCRSCSNSYSSYYSVSNATSSSSSPCLITEPLLHPQFTRSLSTGYSIPTVGHHSPGLLTGTCCHCSMTQASVTPTTSCIGNCVSCCTASADNAVGGVEPCHWRMLDPTIRVELTAMKAEEAQRRPFWPPVLQHLTGYREAELIPLALRYHAIAMRLIAEVARGGRLNAQERDRRRNQKKMSANREDEVLSTLSTHSVPIMGKIMKEADGDDDEEEEEDETGQPRCTSPGGSMLRRQVVTKYCAGPFLGVANAYPQLAFENLIPVFPSIRCPDDCKCFVCTNLIRQSSDPDHSLSLNR
ncbi:unnamed protein product [Protopolystoma xenopodis]|uniref:Uncharacterized protein n=1 Tax=Protopolystoma xenopodis TaxID=117903 RepID=A0A448WBS6_9PLAT|nr:unnamed protein product [Protopolystoma xenopodis]